MALGRFLKGMQLSQAGYIPTGLFRIVEKKIIKEEEKKKKISVLFHSIYRVNMVI